AGLVEATRLLVALHHVHALHQRAVLLRHHRQHLAAPATVAPRQDLDAVTLPDLRRHAQSTSGAKLMIFMYRFARSSRTTGPKMRVPIGSPRFLISTAALLSKRMAEPSTRRTG